MRAPGRQIRAREHTANSAAFALTTNEKQHLAGGRQHWKGQCHARYERFKRRVGDIDHPSLLLVQLHMVWKQRGRMPVTAHSHQNNIKKRSFWFDSCGAVEPLQFALIRPGRVSDALKDPLEWCGSSPRAPALGLAISVVPFRHCCADHSAERTGRRPRTNGCDPMGARTGTARLPEFGTAVPESIPRQGTLRVRRGGVAK